MVNMQTLQTKPSLEEIFLPENLVAEKWKPINDKIYQITTSNEEETLPFMQSALKLMKILNENFNIIPEKQAQKYFLNDFVPNLSKYLLMNRSYKLPENSQIHEELLFENLKFFNDRIENEEILKLAEMTKMILDSSKLYYKMNNQDENQTMPFGIPINYSSEELLWRDSLEVGTIIDAVKTDKSRKRIWAQAKITHITSTDFLVHFLHDKESNNRVLERSGWEYAKKGQYSTDFEWRKKILKGDELDICDSTNVWYNSTVLDRKIEIENDEEIIELYIGYRIYRPEGMRADENGKNFIGWTSKFDEWINVFSPRLQKFNKMAKKYYPETSNTIDDLVIDDSTDILFEKFKKPEKLYAVVRYLETKSTLLVRMVNTIGNQGFFDKILTRIADKQTFCPFEIMSAFIGILANTHMILYRDFSLEYIPKLIKAVVDNIKSSPDSNVRNFSKERIENLMAGLDLLLKRCYSLGEKYEIIENLTLDLALMCLKSDFLEKRIQGLKMLQEVTKQIKSGKSIKHITISYLTKWIDENKIFQMLYNDDKSHTQLIQRSAEFLIFMLSEEMLTTSNLTQLWNGTRKGDSDAKSSIYKVLLEIGKYMRTEHSHHISNFLISIDSDELTAQDIELLCEISRFSLKNEELLQKTLNYLWKQLFNEERSASLSELLISKISDVLKTLELRDSRLEYVLKAIESLKKGESVILASKLIRKIIETFPLKDPGLEVYSQGSLIALLNEKHDLLNILFNELNEFKKKGKDDSPSKFSETKYLSHLSDRLILLQFILNGNESDSEIILTCLDKLWNLLVKQSKISSEKDLIFKWLKDLCEKGGASIVQISKFFKETMLSQEHEIKGLTLEGLSCFKALFLAINVDLCYLSKTIKNGYSSNTGGIVSNGGTMIGGRFVPSFTNSYEEGKVNIISTDVEYQTLVNPNTFQGYDFLWQIVFLTISREVSENAIEFLIFLHSNISENLSIVTLRTEFLNQAIEKLKNQTIDEINFRVLLLLGKFFSDSEKKGTGSLKYHNSLTKGELINLQINNELTIGSYVPKKIDVKILSNRTVFDLRHYIAIQAKTSWDAVRLFRFGNNLTEIFDSDNGRTLQELRFRNGETLQAQRKPTPYIPQVPLTHPDGSLVDGAKTIFIEIFSRFSENGKMNPDKCAEFIHSCTNDNCKAEDHRVKQVFERWDHDKDGFLTLDNFLDFYQMACVDRPQVVWYNLSAHHYRNDLKKHSEIEDEKIDIKQLPTTIFSLTETNYDLIFNLLDKGGELAQEAWKLLNRLPTANGILEKISMLEGIKKENNEKAWQSLLSTVSSYRLLYNLSIIEYLMEEDEEDLENLVSKVDETANAADKDAAEKEKENKKEEIEISDKERKNIEKSEKANKWRADFILYGGFEHLLAIFFEFSGKDHLNLSIFDKNILSFILKILRNYLMAALAKKVPFIYRLNQYIKLIHFSLDLISDSFKNQNEKSTTLTKLEEKKAQLLKQKLEETNEFKILVEKLDGPLGEKILQALDLSSFLNKIQSLIFDIIVRVNELETEDRIIIEFGMSILLNVLLFDSQSQKKFVENPSNEEFLIEGLFSSKNLNVRKNFSTVFYLLSKQKREVFGDYLVQKLLNNLPSSKDNKKKDCNQFYDLICKLIEEGIKGDSAGGVDFEKLLSNLIENIRTHNSSEKRSNPQNDKILLGYLNLTEKILLIESSLSNNYPDLAQDLLQRCLFDFSETREFNDCKDDDQENESDTNYVKCKSGESRRIAYKILVNLAGQSQKNLKSLIEDGLCKLLKSVGLLSGWNFMPSMDTKSSYGYVGLKNLGCICYMNAMLQQFYMCTQFRYGLLMADDHKEDNMKKTPKEKLPEVDDNVLHQLQKMFGFLELSDRQDYSPYEFCFSFKDHAGNPVNVSVQQDTQEFLNMIFEKLENSLKITPFRNILEGIYGGKNCTQLICSGGCKSIKNNHENFYNLSIEVKNHKTIYESLEKYITGEVINDYMCETCNKKVDVMKRCCLSKLPNVLIVHLQRIVFNLDTFMNEKINSRLEFPQLINLEPYTKEGIEWREAQKNNEDEETENQAGAYQIHPQEYYEYSLKGVVIHIGTAEFGHYYSYIKIQDDKWLEFNDSNIRDFDPKNLESECYGGSSQADSDDAWGWSRGGRDNSKNAYILVYERKVKESIKLVFESEEEKQITAKTLSMNADLLKLPDGEQEKNDKIIGLLDFFKIKKFVPKKIYKMVWEDNHKFMLERHLYNEDFFRFIKDLVNGLKLPNLIIMNPDNNTFRYNLIYENHEQIEESEKMIYISLIQVLSRIIFDVLARAHDNGNMADISMQLKQLLSVVPSFAFDFFVECFIDNYKTLIELVLVCPDKLVRSVTVNILLHVINLLINYHDLSLDVLDENPINKKIIQFLNVFQMLMPNDVAKNWNKFHQYFEFWRDFAISGEKQINFLFKKEFIAVLIDFFLEKRSPLQNYSEKKFSMSGRYANPSFDSLIQTVLILLQRGKNNLSERNSPFVMNNVKLYDLSENDRKCLNCIEFYDRILKENYDANAVSGVITINSWENRDFSYQISYVLLSGLNRVSFEETQPFIQTICYFLSIQDAFQYMRCEWILGYPQPMLNKYDTLCLTSGIDEQTTDYRSPIQADYGVSLLNMLFQNKRRYENLVMVCLHKVLLLLNGSPFILDYVLALPPPCHMYAKYTDWFRGFITNYLVDCQRYGNYGVSSFNKEELANNSLTLLNSLEDIISKKINITNEEAAQNQLGSLLKNVYIIGQSVDETLIFEHIIDTKNNNQVKLQCFESLIHLLPSKPTGLSNLAFPEDILKDQDFLIREAKPGCDLFSFVQTISQQQQASSKKEEQKVDEEQEINIVPFASDVKIENAKESEENIEDVTRKKQAQKVIFDEKPRVVESIPLPMAPSKDIKLSNQFIHPFVRKFVIVNPTEFVLSGNLYVFLKTNEGFLNTRLPMGGINFNIRPQSSHQVLTITKILIENDWNDIACNVTVNYVESRAGGMQSQGSFENKYMKDEDYALYGRIPNAPKLNLKLITTDLNEGSYSALKNCWSCNRSNDATNPNCRYCNKPLD